MSTLVSAPVIHIVKGQVITGDDVSYRGFSTPAIDLNTIAWSRQEPGPAFDVPVSEIIDLLVELGEGIRQDKSGALADACEGMIRTGTLDGGIIKRSYEDLPFLFSRDHIKGMLEGELGDPAIVDGWVEKKMYGGTPARVRAFPPRMVHILAGNAPGVAAVTIVRGALSKGVHLCKLPSNDLHTLPALLRILIDIAPDHPVTKSFSAVYWRGGDTAIESRLFSPIFFDKLAAWGGESSLRSAKNYIGPGFELVAFDPKTSISMIGHEAFAEGADLDKIAELAAMDSTPWNQSACVSSRFMYIEADEEQADRFSEALQKHMGVERRISSRFAPKVPADLREEIDALRDMAPDYAVFGGYEGAGLVVRSDSPVDFYPDNKIVNVVTVPSLKEAVRYTSVATQTVGVWPPERKTELRNALAAAGAQRIVTLGLAVNGDCAGLPHDGFIPLHRFMRWINDEG